MKTHEHIGLTDRAQSQLDVPPPGKGEVQISVKGAGSIAPSRWSAWASTRMFRRGEYQESK